MSITVVVLQEGTNRGALAIEWTNATLLITNEKAAAVAAATTAALSNEQTQDLYTKINQLPQHIARFSSEIRDENNFNNFAHQLLIKQLQKDGHALIFPEALVN